MSIILRQRFFQTKSALSQLDEELHRRVKRHNTTVVDMVAEKLCRRATAAAAVATIALCAMPVAPSWPLCAGVGTLWLAKMVGDLDTDTSNLVDCALSSEYVTMPPPAIIRVAHDTDGDLALTSLLRFIALHPRSLYSSPEWQAEEAGAWRARHSAHVVTLLSKKEEA